MTDNEKENVALVKMWLDKLIVAERKENYDREELAEQADEFFHNLPRQNILKIIDKAVGKSKKRFSYSLEFLGFFSDEKEVQERLISLINNDDREIREVIIPMLSYSDNLHPFLLRVIETEKDPIILADAIWHAGMKKIEICFPAILEVAKSSPEDFITNWRLACAFIDYARPESIEYLQKIFYSLDNCEKWRDKTDTVRIFSAWGLIKLGDRGEPLVWLIKCLDECDKPTSNFYGNSLRIARALCDTFQLLNESEKTKSFDTVLILENRQKWKQQILPQIKYDNFLKNLLLKFSRKTIA